jgi:peptide/nickel transport system permease protein
VQSEVLELLRELQRKREMAILLVTHDWGVIADLCDRAVVNVRGPGGRAPALDPIFRTPLHPYTEALLSSNPHNARQSDLLPTIPGAVPKPGAWPTGCYLHPRCGLATAECRAEAIPLTRLQPMRETRCVHYDRMGV